MGSATVKAQRSGGKWIAMVELVGIEKLGTLKTDKLLICRESYNAQKASNACNARPIVRLLYGDSIKATRVTKSVGIVSRSSLELRSASARCRSDS